MTEDPVVRPLTTREQWRAASALYRDVFGYVDPHYALSPTLLAALRVNGGTVLGAFSDDELVGFCYGVTAIEDGAVYHYSQATVVAAQAQGLGLGRRLKHAQADAARALGLHEMRWAFDPFALRNAHFNLAVLGAVAFRFSPDLYGNGSSDRIIASWQLDATPEISRDGEVVTVGADDRYAALDPQERDMLRHTLSERLGSGQVLLDVRRCAQGVEYVFGPREV